jgi:hypothetical protein
MHYRQKSVAWLPVHVQSLMVSFLCKMRTHLCLVVLLTLLLSFPNHLMGWKHIV